MQELIIKLEDVKVSFGSKDVLNFQQLSVYQHEKIGIIGGNGEGKSTLLGLVTGDVIPNQGRIQKECDFSVYHQLGRCETSQNFLIDEEMMRRFNVPRNDSQTMSGGEQSKFRLVKTLSTYQEGLILDEPTSHLDQRSIDHLIEELSYYYGTVLFVSHDRYFLDALATKIWEVSDGRVTEYVGNYQEYLTQKEQEKVTEERAYNKYLKEKERLEKGIRKKEEAATKLTQNKNKKHQKQNKPSRLAGTKQKDTVEKSLHKNIKSMAQRLKQLEVKEHSSNDQKLVFPMTHFQEMHHAYPVMGDEVCLYGGDKLLLHHAAFQFGKGQKIGITGANGSGKTTLLKGIMTSEPGINVSQKAQIVMYEQMSYQLTQADSILQYAMKSTEYQEGIVRSILHRLGFTQNELSTPVHAISGGEATRLSLAMVLIKPSNVLILDEPTNFIDLATIEAVEALIHAYPGTVIFTSHDAYFTKRVATHIYDIDQHKLILKKS